MARRFNFSLQLVLLTGSLVCFSVGVSSWHVYLSTKADLETSLASELLAIAKSTSTLIDGDTIPMIFRNEKGEIEFEDEFELLREQLDRVRRENALPENDNPIYIMRPRADFEKSKALEFVVMPDRDEAGNYFVGNSYPAEEHNLTALAGEAAASGIYQDEEGVWISASAPVRDLDGTVVGLLQVDRPVSFFFAQAREHAIRILWGAAVSVGVALLLSVVFARRLVEPILEIVRVVARLGSGELKERLVLRRRDELGDLAVGINDMAERLETHTSNLEEARAAAEVASDAKSAFLASISHELRTPMNGVLGMMELMEQTDLDEEQAEYVQVCRTSGAGLLELINQILDISKCDAGMMELCHSAFDIHELVTETSRALGTVAREKGLSFSSDVAGEVPRWLEGDGPRISQVIINLVGNAIKFTDSGSVTLKVQALEVEADTARLVIGVVDTGIGVERDKLGAIFERFGQADSSTTNRSGGTGLGLAISSDILALMGSKLVVQSQAGIGSCFSFELLLPVADVPEKSADLASSPAAAGGPEIEATAPIERDVPTAVERVEASPAAAAPVSTCAAQVLVAEDDPINCMLITLLLKRLGCEVTIAENGAEAVEIASSREFDIIFMDWRMPEMDGIEATAVIRSLKTPVRVPIIAVTANAMTGDREICLRAGMDDYLTKPVASEGLKQMLERFVWEKDDEAV